MTTRIQVVFYSMYGHIHTMAQSVADGAREVAGTQVDVFQVPELVPDDVLEMSGMLAYRADITQTQNEHAQPESF